jgi:hypothetical protein
MSEVSDKFYTITYHRPHSLPHPYYIPTTTSVTIDTRKRPQSPDSSHSQYPNTQLHHVPRPPKAINRTTKRQLRFRLQNPIRKKVNGKSDNARMRIAQQPRRKRLRILQKIKEVHIVAETLNIIASHKFQALGIAAIPHEQQPRRMVKAYLHTAPLRYPKTELSFDSSAAWKVLKKGQIAGHISKQRFRLLLHRHIASLTHEIPSSYAPFHITGDPAYRLRSAIPANVPLMNC